MSSTAMHQPIAGPSKTSEKGERQFGSSDSKQCISCRKCWPWVIFDLDVVRRTSHVCMRCSNPELEIKRWIAIGKDMQKDVEKAKKKLSKHRIDYPNQGQAQAQYPSLSHSNSTSSSNSIPLISYLPLMSQPSSVPVQNQPTTQQQYHQHQQPIGRNINLLSKEQLRTIAGNIHILRGLQEPQRAMIWLQLIFQPSSSPFHQIKQMDIYGAYKDFFQQSQNSLNSNIPPILEGVEVIRLVKDLWQDPRVKMNGRPHYSISGLVFRYWNGNDGVLRPQVSNGQQQQQHLQQQQQYQQQQQHQHRHHQTPYANNTQPSSILSNQNQVTANPSIPNLPSVLMPPNAPQLAQSQPIAPVENQIIANPTILNLPSVLMPPNIPSSVQPMPFLPPSALSAVTQMTPQQPLVPEHIQQQGRHAEQRNNAGVNNVTHNSPLHAPNTDSTVLPTAIIADVAQEVEPLIEEDDWSSLRPNKKAKTDHPIQDSASSLVLSNDQRIITDLTVQPRSVVRSSQNKQRFDDNQDDNEEIDELDDDDDHNEVVMMTSRENGMKKERAGSEEEVGDMLI